MQCNCRALAKQLHCIIYIKWDYFPNILLGILQILMIIAFLVDRL